MFVFVSLYAYMNQERICTLLARKLSGEASDTESRELDQLLHAQPSMKSVAGHLQQHWQEVQRNDQEFLEATYLVHLHKMEQAGVWNSNNEEQSVTALPPMRKFRYWIAASLAMTALLAGAFFLLRPTSPTIANQTTFPAEKSNEVSTKYGNRSKIQLPDGSTVWLNAGSKLNYHKDFGNENREVELSGEAYFDVARDPQRPFIVHTATVDVKVLGTVFNLKSYPTDPSTETSLIHGSVQVTVREKKNQVYVLHPNEKLTVMHNATPEHAITKTTNSPLIPKPVMIKPLTYSPGQSTAVEAAWIENKLSFADRPFEELAKDMERWYDVKIEFTGSRAKAHHFTGSFKHESLEEALSALQFSASFRYQINNRLITIE